MDAMDAPKSIGTYQKNNPISEDGYINAKFKTLSLGPTTSNTNYLSGKEENCKSRCRRSIISGKSPGTFRLQPSIHTAVQTLESTILNTSYISEEDENCKFYPRNGTISGKSPKVFRLPPDCRTAVQTLEISRIPASSLQYHQEYGSHAARLFLASEMSISSGNGIDNALLSQVNEGSDTPKSRSVRNGSHPPSPQHIGRTFVPSGYVSDCSCERNMLLKSLNFIGSRANSAKNLLADSDQSPEVIGVKDRENPRVIPTGNSPNNVKSIGSISCYGNFPMASEVPYSHSLQGSSAEKLSPIEGDDWFSRDDHDQGISRDNYVCSPILVPKEAVSYEILIPDQPDSCEVNDAARSANLRICNLETQCSSHFPPRCSRYYPGVMSNNDLSDRIISSDNRNLFRQQALNGQAAESSAVVADARACEAEESIDNALESLDEYGRSRVDGSSIYQNMHAEVFLPPSRESLDGTAHASFSSVRDNTDDTWQTQDHYGFDSNYSDNDLTNCNGGDEYIEDKLKSLRLNVADKDSGVTYAGEGTSSHKETLPHISSTVKLPSRRVRRSTKIRIDTHYLHNSNYIADIDLAAKSSATSAWPLTTYATGAPESSRYIDSCEISDKSCSSNKISINSKSTVPKAEASNSDLLSTIPIGCGFTSAGLYYRGAIKKNPFKSPMGCDSPSELKNRVAPAMRYKPVGNSEKPYFPMSSQHYRPRLPFPPLGFAQPLDLGSVDFHSRSGRQNPPVECCCYNSSSPCHRLHGGLDHTQVNSCAINLGSIANPFSTRYTGTDRPRTVYPLFHNEQYLNDFYSGDDCINGIRSAVESGSERMNAKSQVIQGRKKCSYNHIAASDMTCVSTPRIFTQPGRCANYSCNHGTCTACSRRIVSAEDTINVKQNFSSRTTSYQDTSARDEMKNPLLMDIKANRNAKIEFRYILGSIVEFSCDQHGSRFIQQKMHSATPAERQAVFEEILPNVLKLMTDVFGNYVVQKLFEYGTPKQREMLVNRMAGNVLSLSLHMYGCRVVQKALECVSHDQQAALVRELEGNVVRCIKDQNGNHVIQRAIELVPAERIESIINAFVGQVINLATHPYGCRVVQRVIQHFYDEDDDISGAQDMENVQELEQRRRSREFWKSVKRPVINEILKNVITLIQDQYGNYVVQHVIERGGPVERSLILRKVCSQVHQLSKHKFASNVVEKCVTYGSKEDRELLIDEVLKTRVDGTCSLVAMMKDQFANYVAQKMLGASEGKQREEFTNKIRPHLQFLKKYSYGRHLTAKVEKITASLRNNGPSSS